ncbi:MAG: TadE/TadG family type IV pilus assembly protein [Bryobacteraceae bacterium]
MTTIKRRQRGSSMVEFSLVFLIFVMVAVGTIEGAMAVWNYITLAHAARQGARYAIVHGESKPTTEAAIESVVKTNSTGLLPDLMTVTTTWDPENKRGNTVQVRASYPLQFSAFIFESNLRLNATSRMTILN